MKLSNSISQAILLDIEVYIHEYEHVSYHQIIFVSYLHDVQVSVSELNWSRFAEYWWSKVDKRNSAEHAN